MKLKAILKESVKKTYTWTSNGKQHTLKYNLSYDIFKGRFTADLLGGEFSNVYGQGDTESDAVNSLKMRVIQLRNKQK